VEAIVGSLSGNSHIVEGEVMAKKTLVQLIDDIDGSKADTTVRFAWGGTQYEIDLSNKNARAFDAAIDPYVKVATRAPASGRVAGRRSSTSRADLSDIRAWAAKNGHSVASRGRIPSSVIDAYRSSTGASNGTAPAKAPATRVVARKAPARKAAARKVSARKSTGRRARS
jgi:hypothetical protein